MSDPARTKCTDCDAEGLWWMRGRAYCREHRPRWARRTWRTHKDGTP